MNLNRSIRRKRRGLNMLEMLAVVTLIGILAVVAIPRFANSAAEAKRNTCFTTKANIEIQAELWFRNNSDWPATNLGNIMADGDYFPDGAVTCPVDGSAYQFDRATGRVMGHTH